ncbi:hypothetical protein HDU76_004221, partial [Blyttiomyces sp. JEL0837]
AVGDHGLGNFQSLNAQHHHSHGHAGQISSNSMETVTRTTSTSTRSGINTASAIILGLTIAILASVAITTAIPGVVSPLGILPPTDDNIVTAYPNSGIKSGDGSSVGSGGVGGSGGSGSGSGNGSGGGNNNGTIAGSNGGGNNGTTNGGSTGGSGGNGGANGGNSTTTPGSGTGNGGTGTGSGGSTAPDTSKTCLCSPACDIAQQAITNFTLTVSVTSDMLQCTGAVLDSNFHRLCTGTQGGLPDPGTFGNSTCNIGRRSWCIYTEQIMMATCEGYPSSSANNYASSCCVPASWPLSG